MTIHRRRTAIWAIIGAGVLAAWLSWPATWRPIDSDPEQLDLAITRWEFRDDDDWFGFITSASRCGDLVFLADRQSKIRSLDLALGEQVSTFALEGPPYGLAADCERHILYAFIPSTRAFGARVVALELPSGRIVRQYALPDTFGRGAHFSAPASLYINALLHPDLSAAYRGGTAESFYQGAQVGLALSLTTGEVHPLLDPYDERCIGAGSCTTIALSLTPTGWLVAQPTSTHVGLYGPSGTLARLIDITSPRFQRTGEILPLTASAETRVRWSAENSTIERVYSFARHVATVHSRPKIGPDWVLGQPLNFDALMNIHSYDGTLVRADVELPDLPVGQDDEGVLVIDYGERGRTGGSPVVTLSKIAVP